MLFYRKHDVAVAFVDWLSRQPPATLGLSPHDDRYLENPEFLEIADRLLWEVASTYRFDYDEDSLFAAQSLEALERRLLALPGMPAEGPQRVRLQLTLRALFAHGADEPMLDDLAARLLQPFTARFDFEAGQPK